MEMLDDASKGMKKALSFREAEPVLEIGSRFELEHWRNRLFAQFEDIADILLPHWSGKRRSSGAIGFGFKNNDASAMGMKLNRFTEHWFNA
jgi:hypothetical protein